MERLTAKRVNGIKVGYWTAAKKDPIVQKLGEYEDTGLEPAEIRDLAREKSCARPCGRIRRTACRSSGSWC